MFNDRYKAFHDRNPTCTALLSDDVARVAASASASLLARLIASGQATTRADLTRATGLARSTVSLGLDSLGRLGMIEPDGDAPSSGRGRPGELLRIAPTYGLVAAIEIRRHSARVELCDFGQRQVARFTVDVAIADGPVEVVHRVADAIGIAVSDAGAPLRVAVVAMPAPVDVTTGTIVRPPLLADWDGAPLRAMFEESLGCDCLVDTDADIRALGEARSLPESDSPLLYVLLDDGIGAGLIDSTSELYAGADGAAGDIGHVRTGRHEGAPCRCGDVDHLEAYAGLRELRRAWASRGEGRNAEDGSFERALRAADPVAVDLAADAARLLAEVLVSFLRMFNPSRISIGGRVASNSDVVLATIRSVVYAEASPVATRNLTIGGAVSGEDSALIGGRVVGLEHALHERSIERQLLAMTPRRH